ASIAGRTGIRYPAKWPRNGRARIRAGPAAETGVLAVLNAELALSMLGGGGSLLGGPSGPTMSALAAFKSYQKDQVGARTAFANREDIKRQIDAFKKGASKLETVDDLLKDRKTLGFVLQAFGLESEINNPGKLKAVINSD